MNDGRMQGSLLNALTFGSGIATFALVSLVVVVVAFFVRIKQSL